MTILRDDKEKGFRLIESAVIAVADPVTITGELDASLSHNEVGIEFYGDVSADDPADIAVPGAGTVPITARHHTGSNSEVEATITGTAAVSLLIQGHLKSVKATPTGITTATHYKLKIAQNRN